MASSLVLTITEVSSPALGLQFSRPNIRVDHTSVNAHYPSIAVDDQGSLHAVWENNESGGSSICYSRSTDGGLTWSPEVVISFSSPGWKYYNPRIAVDLSSSSYKGSLYVAYETTVDAWSIWVSYSRDRGSTWNRTQVDHGGASVRSQQPAIGVVGNGTVYIAWKDGRIPLYQILVSASHDGGSTWTSERRASVTDQRNIRPSVATHGPSDVYVVWQEYYDTYYSAIWCAHSSDGVTWSASQVTDSQTLRIVRENPDVEVAADGAVLVVWAFREQDFDWIVEFSRSDDFGATWTDPVRVDHGGYSVEDMGPPRIAVGGGNAYVTWFCDGAFVDESIYFTHSADGGLTWGDKGRFSQDVLVDDTHGNGDPNDDNTRQAYPEIASNGYEVFIIWQDERSQATWQIYFAKTLFSSLQLTEIRDSPDGQEAVEIYNYGGADWNLAGTVLRIDGHGDIDLASLGTIPAGEYRTIGDSASMDLSVDITLDDEGGFLALVKGVKYLDVVAYGQRGTTPDPLGGESVARHWTGLRYTFDWVRESTPTFGSHNDVPTVDGGPKLVLNEVLFNPLISSDAFVEIMLIEGEDIDTNGYLIVCDSVYILSPIILTEQNPTYAVFQSSSPSFFSSITSSGDNIYLYDSSGRLLDMVGWNTPHTPSLSVARVPEGNGTYDGYDDDSSERAGWDFDITPTPSVITVGPDQWKNGNAGDKVSYALTVANRGAGPDFVDITYVSQPNGWNVELFHGDGVTPLTDSPADGDGVPDTGLIGSFTEKQIVVKVTIPISPKTGAYENTTVYATSSNNPSLFGEALLVTRPYPSVEVDKSLSPQEIYVETAGPGYEKETTITLEVKGTGSSLFYDTPQDVVFLIDMSNSIGYESLTLEKTLALTYLKQMRHPDRAAVVFFAVDPIFKGTLSGDYEDLAWELRSEPNVMSDPEPPSYTRIGPAMEEAAENLFDYGNRSHDKIVLLFTDGFNWWDSPFNDPHPLDVAYWASTHNISILPIGIRGDQGGPERWLLEEVANITGTRYVFADSPHVLDGMRDEIGLIENSIAVYDQDLDDDISLVQDALPSYIHYVPGSARDPRTGERSWPSITLKGGVTYLSWDVPSVHVGHSWLVSFEVTCSQVGYYLANVYTFPTDTRVLGLDWNETQFILPFPKVYVDCLAGPPLAKPYGVSALLEGPSFRDVRITWSLSPDDPVRVDHYEVHFSKNFNSSGIGYSLLGTSPSGTGEYLAEYVGEDPSNYFFRICAVTSTGDRACADQQAGKFTRLLYEGPNLVSIPLIQSNESIERVLQTVEFDRAWSYDSSSKVWKSYMKFKPYGGELKRINRTMGLWVNVTENCNLTVAGAVPEHTSIHLTAGWNIVGFPSFDSFFTVSELFATVGAVRAEGFDLPSSPFHLRTLNDWEVLQPGHAYWVKVETDSIWILDIE